MSSMLHESKALEQRLADAYQDIETIREIFQAPSFSIGVIHRDDFIATKGFGFADESLQHKPDAQTNYLIGSCTKGITATALAILAVRKRLHLDDTVAMHIPELHNDNVPEISEKMTIRDLLSHCTGLSPLPYEVIVRWGEVIVRGKEEAFDIFKHLPRAAPFKSEWRYNNWPYTIAAILVSRVSGEPYSEFVKNNIFKPLGLRRTDFANIDKNFAKAYITLSDGTREERQSPTLTAGDAFEASGSIRSCVGDMLLWMQALMKAHADPELVAASGSGGLWQIVLKSISKLVTVNTKTELRKAMHSVQHPHFPLAKAHDQNYALGMYNLRLPGSAIATVTNAALLTEPYNVGEAGREQVVVGHTGELGSYLASYWTLPEEQTAIVVFANTFNIHGDPANLVSQLLIQALFDFTPRIAFVEKAKEIKSNAAKRWDDAVQLFKEGRKTHVPKKDPSSYEGCFTNSKLGLTLRVWRLPEVSERGTDQPELRMQLNEEPDQINDLYHYNDNRWTFMPATRDEALRTGYSTYIDYWPTFLLHWTGSLDVIEWILDSDERVPPVKFDKVFG